MAGLVYDPCDIRIRNLCFTAAFLVVMQGRFNAVGKFIGNIGIMCYVLCLYSIVYLYMRKDNDDIKGDDCMKIDQIDKLISVSPKNTRDL